MIQQQPPEHSRAGIVLVALVLLLPAPLLAQVDAEGHRKRILEAHRQTAEAAPRHKGEVNWDQLPLLSVEDGWMRVEPTRLRFDVPTRLQVKGDDGIWTLMSRPDQRRAMTLLSRFDFKEAEGEGNWSVGISSFSGRLAVVGWGGARSGYHTAQLTFNTAGKGERMVQLQVNGIADPKPIVLITAPDLTTLQQDHPEKVQQYVMPLLTAINGYSPLQPPAADVYRAFDEIHASPKAVAQVQQLLAQLGSPLPDQRAAGSKALGEMGPEGVLAVLRMDLSRIGPEERSRIDEFLASHTARRNSDPAALRRDVRFLIDCLGDADAAVRSAAKAALAEAKQTPIDFDVDAPAAERKAQIARLRKQLLVKAKAGKPEGESNENSE